MLYGGIFFFIRTAFSRETIALQRERPHAPAAYEVTRGASLLMVKNRHVEYGHETDCGNFGSDDERCERAKDCSFVNGACTLTCAKGLSRPACREREQCYFREAYGCRFKPPACNAMDDNECRMSERCSLEQAPQRVPEDKKDSRPATLCKPKPCSDFSQRQVVCDRNPQCLWKPQLVNHKSGDGDCVEAPAICELHTVMESCIDYQCHWDDIAKSCSDLICADFSSDKAGCMHRDGCFFHENGTCTVKGKCDLARLDCHHSVGCMFSIAEQKCIEFTLSAPSRTANMVFEQYFDYFALALCAVLIAFILGSFAFLVMYGQAVPGAFALKGEPLDVTRVRETDNFEDTAAK